MEGIPDGVAGGLRFWTPDPVFPILYFLTPVKLAGKPTDEKIAFAACGPCPYALFPFE